MKDVINDGTYWRMRKMGITFTDRDDMVTMAISGHIRYLIEYVDIRLFKSFLELFCVDFPSQKII